MKKTSGYITVYLALTLGILISLITTMIYGIRVHTIRFEAECAMDMGLDSIYAEYHREMLKQYGMLFIDSSYGGNIPSSDYTRSHLLHYINMIFDEKGTGILSKDLTALHADNGCLTNISYAPDNNGEVLRYQINQYIKTKYGLGVVDNMFNDVIDMNELLGQYDNYAAQRQEAEERVLAIIDEENGKRGPDEEPYTISNPADSVDKLSGSNTLFYAFGNKTNLNAKGINSSNYISNRGYVNGAGLRSTQKQAGAIASKAIIEKYIFDKCGYYGKEKSDSALNYQIEYIIKGQDSDIKNMEKITADIFKTRYVINMAYLLTDSAKQGEAETLATIVCCLLLLPELVEAVKYTILFAWGYVESAKELRMLFDGNKLPIIKHSGNWNTPLYQLIGFRMYLDNYKASGGELGYEEYLIGFLTIENLDKMTLRLMDIMEMDIRLTPGNSAFRMDGQIYQATAEVNMSSNYGYGCNVKRFSTYE